MPHALPVTRVMRVDSPPSPLSLLLALAANAVNGVSGLGEGSGGCKGDKLFAEQFLLTQTVPSFNARLAVIAVAGVTSH